MFRLLIAVLLLSSSLHAALPAGGVWEVRTGGSDSANSGGFNPSGASPGTDYSQQTSPQFTFTGTVHTTTTQINIVGATVSSAWNRNFIRWTGGTATAGIYEIVNYDVVNNRVTLDRAAGTSTQTITGGAVGGAFATPGNVQNFAVSGNKAWVKGGTDYTFSTSTPGAGGPITLIGRTKWEGYTTTRGDGGKARIDAGSTTSVSMVTFANNDNQNQHFYNFILDGNSGTSNNGCSINGTRCNAVNVEVYDCPGTAFLGTNGKASYCYAQGCGTGFQTNSDNCVAKSCTTGFNPAGVLYRCLAYDGTTGFSVNDGAKLVRCTAVDNSSHGFATATTSVDAFIQYCLSTNNGGAGFQTTSSDIIVLWHCADYTNTSGRTSGTFMDDVGAINLSADPYLARASDDYRPNAVSGGGALLRGITPSLFGQVSDAQDVGALNHPDSAPKVAKYVSGTVTLSGSPVSGAVVYVVNITTGASEGSDTTDGSGDWSVQVSSATDEYGAFVRYESMGVKYQALAPFGFTGVDP